MLALYAGVTVKLWITNPRAQASGSDGHGRCFARPGWRRGKLHRATKCKRAGDIFRGSHMKIGQRLSGYVIAILMACAVPAPASAYSHCTGKVQRIWIGDSGSVWIFLQGLGVAAMILAGDANREAALAAAMSAQATGRSVTLRFAADNVAFLEYAQNLEAISADPAPAVDLRSLMQDKMRGGRQAVGHAGCRSSRVFALA